MGYENERVTAACLEKEIESGGDMYTSESGGRSKEVRRGGWRERHKSAILSKLCGKTFFKTGGRGIK